jgi:general secretion pathway protein G
VNEPGKDVKQLWPIACAILVLMLVAAAIAILNLIRAWNTPAMNACINNLRQIDGAIQQWALEQKKKPDDKVSWFDITPYLKNPVACPQGGKYTIGPLVSNRVTCSFPGHVLPQ